MRGLTCAETVTRLAPVTHLPERSAFSTRLILHGDTAALEPDMPEQ